MNVQVICLISISYLTVVSCFKFPIDIKRCPAGDTDCIVQSANKVVELNSKLGHSGINLIPLDPLHIPSIKIKQGAESPVNIELSFKDVDLIGLGQQKFTKISGFQKDPNGKYHLKAKGPHIYLVGPYQISGRVLILPIQGEGDNNITLTNPELEIVFDGRSYKRNGKEYLKMENTSLTFTVTNMHFHFKNLYKGDRALGDSTNLFLNENWKDIFHEIKGSIFDAFTLIAQGALTNVFNKVPYKELFSDE